MKYLAAAILCLFCLTGCGQGDLGGKSGPSGPRTETRSGGSYAGNGADNGSQSTGTTGSPAGGVTAGGR
jgi:hypothetical protein